MLNHKNNTPHEFTIYLPKKARESAVVNLGPDLSFEFLKTHHPDMFNKILQGFKEKTTEDMLYIDIYKDNVVYFNCMKSIDAIKKFTKKEKDLDICIKKIIIADINSIQANPYRDTPMYNPCHTFQDYDDYPATYTFDTPI